MLCPSPQAPPHDGRDGSGPSPSHALPVLLCCLCSKERKNRKERSPQAWKGQPLAQGQTAIRSASRSFLPGWIFVLPGNRRQELGTKSIISELWPPPDSIKNSFLLSIPPLPFLRGRSFICRTGCKSGEKPPPSFHADHVLFQVFLEMSTSTRTWEALNSTEALGGYRTAWSPTQTFLNGDQWKGRE